MLTDEEMQKMKSEVVDWINKRYPDDSDGTEKLSKTFALIAREVAFKSIYEYDKIKRNDH